ncbi:hypothetical protein ASE74_12270 [Pedobacter sp. Leaf216]|uniref:acyltransferase family protein n=1 Tax=Pedobacter sp. Leaf216 TaxID=1735684 RepID=UPI00070216BD|nr:acyltransferase [Pedobacter sp. Leaf216]KQM63938.1 hypothetical protein ASE74_12270 [Pedobacter sp. Leaf216]
MPFLTSNNLKLIIVKLNSNLTTPEFLDKTYLPSLDGWRAVAILMVILGHAKLSIQENSIGYKFLETFIYPDLGVRIFFILSGFLITSLLLKELISTGKIILIHFLAKRALRIFPVLYLYTITVFMVSSHYQLNITNVQFLGMLFYYTNFIMFNLPWLCGHTWSLSVEEQFYVLWPIMIYFLKNRIWWCTLLIIVLTQFLRILWYKAGFYIETLGPFFNGADAIFLGSLLSILCFRGVFNSFEKYWLKGYLYLAAIILIFFIYYCTHRGMFGKLLLPLGHIVSDTAIAYLLLATIINTKGLTFKILNNPLMVKLGIISYSLYIWQQLFIIPINFYPNVLPRAAFPFNILISIIAALLSYYGFERYFLNLKKRLKPNIL